jgi:hypothetical protein
MRFPAVSRSAPLLLALVLLAARPVAAAPANEGRHSAALAVFVLVTHGDTISHLGDFPPVEVMQKPWLPPLRFSKVGFKYSYWGVFGVDLWTWGGEYCEYEGKTFVPLSPAEAAQRLGVQESDLGTPFNYKFPIGLLILIGLIVIGVLMWIFAPRETAESPVAFLTDPRYLQALTIYTGQLDKAVNPVPPDAVTATPPAPAASPSADSKVAAFDAAVNFLVGHGIAREEAERNFAVMATLMGKAPA